MKIVELQKVPKGKFGVVDEHGVIPKPHEKDTAEYLTEFGLNIDFIIPVNTYKSKTPDFLINGVIWETKSPIGKGNSTIDRQFHKSGKQAEKLVLDLRRVGLPNDKAVNQAKIRLQKSTRTRRLLIITKDGKVLDIKK